MNKKLMNKAVGSRRAPCEVHQREQNEIPNLVLADAAGNIMDEPDLLMCCRRGGEWRLPAKNELVPLPPESELFLLPARQAVGYDPQSGGLARADGLAVAAFVAPAYTLSSHPAYETERDAPLLPLFAYGAVGYAGGKFWVCAKKVDDDPRQQFQGIKRSRLENNAKALLDAHRKNRLLNHIINNCYRRYTCPAARNFVLGRYEAPLPTSRACNARCVGCISEKSADSPLAATPQCRLAFVPTPEEIAEIMLIHARREKNVPIFSFGQGCEGDPLVNAQLLAESIAIFRNAQKREPNLVGTINCNTNASNPKAVGELARAGLTSMRVSLNSARKELYETYYRPQNYSFEDVVRSITTAREAGLFVSLNLLYFPGISDTEEELAALVELVGNGVSMIQWRNLNIDPQWYWEIMADRAATPIGGMGLALLMKRLKKSCPWLRYGYFNPFLGDVAEVPAPMPRAC